MSGQVSCRISKHSGSLVICAPAPIALQSCMAYHGMTLHKSQRLQMPSCGAEEEPMLGSAEDVRVQQLPAWSKGSHVPSLFAFAEWQ